MVLGAYRIDKAESLIEVISSDCLFDLEFDFSLLLGLNGPGGVLPGGRGGAPCEPFALAHIIFLGRYFNCIYSQN